MTRDEFEAICGRDKLFRPLPKAFPTAMHDRRALLALVRWLAPFIRIECARCCNTELVRDPDTNMGGPCPDCAPLRELLAVILPAAAAPDGET